jgi:hypothetical protein
MKQKKSQYGKKISYGNTMDHNNIKALFLKLFKLREGGNSFEEIQKKRGDSNRIHSCPVDIGSE